MKKHSAYFIPSEAQPPLTSLLLNVLARDTILLNTTPTATITRDQIAQIRSAIEHRAYGTLPTAECRQLLHHLLDAIQYRFQKYTTCRSNGETYDHVVVCCHGHLEQFLNQSSVVATDDLSKIVVEDGAALYGCGDFFDSVYLRNCLAAMESALVIPYRCVLQNLFEAKSDLLTLEVHEIETIIAKTFSDISSKLDRTEQSCVPS